MQFRRTNQFEKELLDIGINGVTMELLKSQIGSGVWLQQEKLIHNMGDFTHSVLNLDHDSHCGRKVINIIQETLKFETVFHEEMVIAEIWKAALHECQVILHG